MFKQFYKFNLLSTLSMHYLDYPLININLISNYCNYIEVFIFYSIVVHTKYR